MTAKRVTIGAKPSSDPRADAWVRTRTEEPSTMPTKGNLYTARLTIDVTPALRGRIKVSAYERGVTLAELVRDVLYREFPDERVDDTP